MTLIPTPPLVTSFLLVVTTTASIIAIYTHPLLRNLLLQRRRILIALILLAACLRYPFGAPFYHGMEYEDCFVHQAVARQLFDPRNPINHQPTYRQCILSLGSLLEGDEHQSFYHLIGYPTAIRITQVLLGDTPAAAHWVSLLASLVNVVLVFCLAAQCDGYRRLPEVAATIYACLPLSIALSATTSAEVFSSTFVTLSLVLVGVCARVPSRHFVLVISYVALSSSLIMAVLVERENLLLIALLPVMFFLAHLAEETSVWSRIRRSAWRSAQALWCPVLFCLIFLNLPAIYRDEHDVAAANFLSLSNLAALAPVFASALACPRFYFLFGLFLVLLPLVWWRCGGVRPVIVLFLAYLGIYAAHWRSYYFLQSHVASPWDTVRYMVNILPLLSILAASGWLMTVQYLAKRSRLLAHCRRATQYSLSGAVVIAASAIGLAMRTELTQAEQEERVQPIEAIVDLFRANGLEDAWLLTFEPCLAQAYGPRWLRIVDLAMIDRFDAAKLERTFESGQVYAFLRPWDTEAVNQERMSAQLEWLHSHKWSVILESPRGRLLKRKQPGP